MTNVINSTITSATLTDNPVRVCESGTVNERSISTRYNEAVTSFVEFARTLTPEEWAMHVPCTPLWTAREVLSHVAGVPDDGLAGRVDGAATEPWTQSQVERNADLPVDELLDRLMSQYAMFGAAIDQMGEGRPPFDCHSHEHDIRHAVSRPGNRDSAIIRDAGESLLSTLAGLPVGVAITYEDSTESQVGAPDATAAATLSISRFEMFRSRLGRRTLEQVRALDWGGDADAIEAVIAGWFVFGPSDIEINE